jgi:hypothetical protein
MGGNDFLCQVRRGYLSYGTAGRTKAARARSGPIPRAGAGERVIAYRPLSCARPKLFCHWRHDLTLIKWRYG